MKAFPPARKEQVKVHGLVPVLGQQRGRPQVRWQGWLGLCWAAAYLKNAQRQR